MILHEYIVEGTTKPLTLAPLGDIQWAGDREDVAFDHLVEHVGRAVDMGAKFIGLGDYTDFASPSNRDVFRRGDLYDTARNVLNASARGLADDLVQKVLEPTIGRWIGLVSGHHYFSLLDGSNTDMHLAGRLQTAYLGEDQAIVRIKFKDKTRTQHIDLWMAHGIGSGQMPAAPIAILDKVSQYIDADIYVMGHQTKKVNASSDRVVPIFPAKGAPRLGHRTLHLVGSGGWTRSYKVLTAADHKAGRKAAYPEKQMLRPVSLGAPLIHIRPRWRWSQSAGAKVWDPNITVEG